MNQIIQISPQKIDGVQTNTVNARDLHEALGVKKPFTQWIEPKLKDTMLDEGTDYLSFNQEVKREIGGSTRKEYILTLDTAKHIAMMSRTAKGKEVRAYFIEVEKQSQQVNQNQSLEFTLAKSLEAMAEGIGVLAKTMKSIDARVTRLEASTKPSVLMPPTPRRHKKETKKQPKNVTKKQKKEIVMGGYTIELHYRGRRTSVMDIAYRTGYTENYVSQMCSRYIDKEKVARVPVFFKRYLGNFRVKKGLKIIHPIYTDDITNLEETIKIREKKSGVKRSSENLGIKDFAQHQRAKMVLLQLKKKYKKVTLSKPEAMFELGMSGQEVGRVYLTNKLPDMSLESVARYYVEFIEVESV